MNTSTAVMPHRSGRWILTLATLYAVAALVSLFLSGQPGKVASLWLANPVGTVALLALPLRLWPPMLGALALSNLLANVVALAPAQGMIWPVWGTASAFVPGNCAEMLLAATLLRKMGLDQEVLRQPSRLGWVLLMGALIPTLLCAFAGASVLSATQNLHFGEVWTTWFTGSLIGTVAVLPLALSLWLQGWEPLRSTGTQTRTQGLLLLSLAITLLASTTLPQPFVVVATALVLLATYTNFSMTALATLATALILATLIALGILIPPPSSTWWDDALYYCAVLATLLPALFLSTSIDGRSQVMRQLSASERRFRTLYTQTPAMLHSIDPQGCILNVSHHWLETLGYAEHEVLGHRSTEFLTPESAHHAREVVIPQSLRDGRCDDVEYQMVTRGGEIMDVLLSAIWEYAPDGTPLRSLAVIQDVTEKKRLAVRSYYAEHDPLTGLPNRVLLQDRLERNFAQHTRHASPFAVGFVDLDHFKEVNDRYGHDAGDLLLQEVAHRLQSMLRASDTVCRLAGDEFVLLFSEVDDTGDLPTVARKVLGKLAQPYKLGNNPSAAVVNVTASMGVAVFPEHGDDPQTLLLHADQAMYAAKRGGRNRCEFYSSKLAMPAS